MMAKSKFQSFEMTTLWRHEFREHPQNPREIAPVAEKRLRHKMKEIGLMQPVIVSKNTMLLVGGHQRIASMDKLEKYRPHPNPLPRGEGACGENDYQLDVALVDITPKQELEMLVFLNNPSAQGDWQIDLLADINLESGVSFDAMGFDTTDVDMLFGGDARFSEMFEDTEEVKKTKGTLEDIKQNRAEAMAKMKEGQAADFYFVVVCKDDAERLECFKHMGVPKHEQIVSAEAFLAALS
jgi:hypothetical protein